jgi:hypothetical protein
MTREKSFALIAQWQLCKVCHYSSRKKCFRKGFEWRNKVYLLTWTRIMRHFLLMVENVMLLTNDHEGSAIVNL